MKEKREPVEVARNPDGTLKKGVVLNPKGRQKGVERWIRDFIADQFEKNPNTGEMLNGWQAMTMMMYDIAMGKPIPGKQEVEIKIKDRQDAVKFLFDRAYGKAKIFVESETTLTASALTNIDPENLDARELEALEAHVEALAAKYAGNATGRILDIVSNEDQVPDPNPDEVP